MDDGHKQTYLFDVSTVSRKMDGKSYQGLQIIMGKLAVRLADLNSIKPASEINQLTEIEKHGQSTDKVPHEEGDQQAATLDSPQL